MRPRTQLIHQLKRWIETQPDIHRGALLMVGPTASGKSALALGLAEHFPITVINADSMQLYQGLPILTAKPTQEEQCVCPHRLYSAYPNENTLVNAAAWVGQVSKYVQEAHAESRLPVILGGTGFYASTLQKGLSFIPPVPWIDFSKVPLADLREELQSVDNTSWMKIHPGDRQRIERALRVFKGTQRPLSVWHQCAPEERTNFKCWTVLISVDRDILSSRIEARFDDMCAQGVIEEVAAFDSPPQAPLSKAIGYPEIKAFLDQKISWPAAAEGLLIATRQYAKRQKTWFRRQLSYDYVLSADDQSAVGQISKK